MGLLNLIFGGNLSNPALVTAAKAHSSENSQGSLVDVWQKFLKSKVLLSAAAGHAKEFGKVKQIKDAVGIPFNTTANERGDVLLLVYCDSNSLQASTAAEAQAVTVTGEDAFQLAMAKGYFGLSLRVAGIPPTELKGWQYQIFIEKAANAANLLKLANKLKSSGNLGDSEGVLKGAILVAQRETTPNQPLTAELTYELAKLQREQGKLNEAEWTYRRALTAYQACGEHDVEVAHVAEAVGTCLYELGKASQALPFFEHALQILDRKTSIKPDVLARVLCNIGEIQCEEGKWDEGEALIKRAMVTLEERQHPDLIVVLNKLGSLCEKSRRPKEALATYMRAVAVFELIRRCKDSELGKAAQRAAALHMEMGKYSEARSLLEKALKAFRREGSEEEMEFVQTLINQITELEASQATAAVAEAEQAPADETETSGGRGFSWRRTRRQQLPLLDMQLQNPTAKAPFEKASPAEVPLAPAVIPAAEQEAAALSEMKAFLDSFSNDSPEWDSSGSPSVAAAVETAPASAQEQSSDPSPEEESPQQEEDLGLFDLLGLHTAHKDAAPLPAIQDPTPPPVAAPEPVVTPAESSKLQKELAELVSANLTLPVEEEHDDQSEMDRLFAVHVTPAKAHAPEPASEPPATAQPQPQVEPPKPEPEPQPKPTPSLPSLDDALNLGKNTQQLFKLKKYQEMQEAARQVASMAELAEAVEASKEPSLRKPEPTVSEPAVKHEAKPQPQKAEVAPPKPVPPPPPPPPAPTAARQATENPKAESAKPAPESSKPATSSIGVNLASEISQIFDKALLQGVVGQPSDRFEKSIGDRTETIEIKKPEFPPPGPAPAPQQPEANLESIKPLTDDESPSGLRAAKTLDQLLNLLEEKLQEEPENSELLLRKGTTLVQQKRLDEAIKVFDKVTAIRPDDVWAWYCKGSSLHLKERFEDAIYCFNHVLTRERDNENAMLRKAECLLRLGRRDQGMVLLDRVLSLKPQFTAAWLVKGRALLKGQKFADALHCYVELLRIDPENEEALRARELITTKLTNA